jgi:Putative peptidoglycan binding domain
MQNAYLIGVVTGLILTGSLAIAAPGDDRARSKANVRAAKQTTTMTTRGNTAVRTHSLATRENTAVRTRSFATSGNTGVARTRIASNRSTVYAGGSRYGYSYPYRSHGYGYGYPYYSYGPSVSFGFGYPYSYGYYPYDSYGTYPYSYGYYGYNRPGYNSYANGSIVIQVQSRLARAGYYRGAIDGAMGPRTHYAIQAYERDHGLRVDGAIGGQLLRNMGLRY